MKLLYTTKDGRMTVELEADSQEDMFREIARFQEIFEDEASGTVADGKGGKHVVTSNDIQYRIRKATGTNEKGKQEEYEYFEKHVTTGPLKGYKKMFGVLNDKSGGLFPKKAPEKDAIYGFNHWHKYNGPAKNQNQAPKSQESQNEGGDTEGSDNVPF